MEKCNKGIKRSSTMEIFQSKSLRLMLVIFYILLGIGVMTPIINQLTHQTSFSWGQTILLMGIYVLEIVGYIVMGKRCWVDQCIVEKEYLRIKYYTVVIIIINLNVGILTDGTTGLGDNIVGFALIAAFFLDYVLLRRLYIGYIVSIVAQNFFCQDNLFGGLGRVPLSLFILYAIVYLQATVLATAQDDELQANEFKLQEIIDKVVALMEKLQGTSHTLAQIAHTENASMEEISSISEVITTSNKNILSSSEKSKSNLKQLGKSCQDISSQMKVTQTLSSQLVEVSVSNEKDLNNVLEICSHVETSTNQTLKVVKDLQQKTDRIDQLLDMIRQVAEETNLLALNASIEAARAGEAGRGFAVVAEQVRKLADDTKDSLSDVSQVVKEFKADVSQVEKMTQENTGEITEQNTVLLQTVEQIRTMIQSLKKSAEAISITDNLSRSQNAYMQETEVFNNQVMDSIKEEIEQFDTIAVLVKENSKEIEEIVYTIDGLNQIIGEIQGLLKNE